MTDFPNLFNRYIPGLTFTNSSLPTTTTTLSTTNPMTTTAVPEPPTPEIKQERKTDPLSSLFGSSVDSNEFLKLFSKFMNKNDSEDDEKKVKYSWSDEKNFYFEVDLPGFRRNEIKMTTERGVLSIVAEKIEQRHVVRPKIERKFKLPLGADGSVIATLDAGVLLLLFPLNIEKKEIEVF